MGKRLQPRIPISLATRAFGIDAEGKLFTRLTQTVDISTSGARLAGIFVPLNVGDVIGMQFESKKARYRVVWVGRRGSERAGELGLAWVDGEKNIWNRELPGQQPDDFRESGALVERRKDPRYTCKIGVEVRSGVNALPAFGTCTDISLGGCYIETWSPLPVGTMVDLSAKLPAGFLKASAQVRTSHPGFGMGLSFNDIADNEVLAVFCQQTSRGTARVGAVAAQTLQPTSSPAVTLQRQVSSEQKPATIPGSRTVLIVEDSRFLQAAYAAPLRREGLRVIVANDGEQALALASTEHPDVILLDLLMPKIPGQDVLKLLKSDPSTADINIIVLSGLSSDNESKLLAEGAVAYLEKSRVQPHDLPGIIQRILDRKLR